MIKEFIERIGQVIRKMLGREKIKDAIGVEVAVSDKMANGIDLWAKMYKNEPPGRKRIQSFVDCLLLLPESSQDLLRWN